MKTRILTALVLVTVFLAAYFYLPSLGWAIFSSLIAGAAFWEWGGLMNASRASRFIFIGAIALFCGLLVFEYPLSLRMFSAFNHLCTASNSTQLCADFLPLRLLAKASAWEIGRWFYLPAAGFWLLVVPLWMKFRWVLPKSSIAWLLGALVILPTWLALIHLRLVGTFALLAIMGLVWVADIAAYFSGRAFGRHKLAPSISPGKTWEGAIGGTLAVVVYGVLLANYLPGQLANNYLVLIPLLIFMASMSILGDLFESLLKRQAGLKDSGSLLPGHGGVLDRIDSLTSTLPLATLLWLLVS